MQTTADRVDQSVITLTRMLRQMSADLRTGMKSASPKEAPELLKLAQRQKALCARLRSVLDHASAAK